MIYLYIYFLIAFLCFAPMAYFAFDEKPGLIRGLILLSGFVGALFWPVTIPLVIIEFKVLGK